MAVVSVTETFREQSGRNAGQVESMRYFIVVCDALTDGAETARFAEDPSTGITIPSEGDVHPQNSGLAAVRIQAAPREGEPLVFTVEVEYVLRGSRLPDQRTDNPLIRAADMEWSHIFIQEAMTAANVKSSTTGATTFTPITNSAGEPFDPPFTRDYTVPVLRITRNELNFTHDRVETYVNSINSTPFMGFTAFKVRMAGISATSLVEGVTTFWRVTYELHFNNRTWNLHPLDQGAKQLGRQNGVDANGNPTYELKIIKDETGAPSGVVPLDGRGHRAARNANGEVTAHYRPSDTVDPQYWYQAYDTRDFTALRLPTVPYP